MWANVPCITGEPRCANLMWTDLGFGPMMLTISRQQHRHEEAMQEARLRADQVRESRYRVIQGGQG
jgi:hypothetical protein